MDPNGDSDLSDHLDVINMSLGSDFGPVDDPTAAARDNAPALGVIVVTSAGNAGDNIFVTGSPGSAPRAIATAASVEEAAPRADGQVNSPAAIAGTSPARRSSAPCRRGRRPDRQRGAGAGRGRRRQPAR